LYFNTNAKFNLFDNYILLKINLKLIILIAKDLLRYLANFIFFLYFFLIDNFEIYRNIYYILKIFYIIFDYFLYFKRKKLVNIFILILESYKVNIKNIIEIFSKFICKLNSKLLIKINKKEKFIYIYCIFFLKYILID